MVVYKKNINNSLLIQKPCYNKNSLGFVGGDSYYSDATLPTLNPR